MTSFCHKMHHIFKTMLRKTNIFCKYVKPYFLRIRTNFNRRSTGNKKVKGIKYPTQKHALIQRASF